MRCASARFAELQQDLHRQEIDLTQGTGTYLALVVVFVLGVPWLVVHWLRSDDAADAATLDVVAGLAPDAMVRSVVEQKLRLAKEAAFSEVTGEPATRPKLAAPQA